MQLIAEAYDLLKNVGGFNNAQLKDIFLEWNKGELKSFLIEITTLVINFPDPENPSRSLVDMILDKAGQKGTGKWTTQTALDLGIPIPTITAAVDARGISSMKEERVPASKVLTGPHPRFSREIKSSLSMTCGRLSIAARSARTPRALP